MYLNPSQKEAVAHGQGPCMVLAGPGSGKTLTIANRIEYLIRKRKVTPSEILVLTFTRYAARGMQLRFRAVMGGERAPVTFGTFHSVFYEILRQTFPLEGETLLTGKDRSAFIRQTASELGAGDLAEEPDFIREAAQEISRVKNNLVDLTTYEAKCAPSELFRALFRGYEEEKMKQSRMDFDDLLLRCRDLFLTRPEVLHSWQERFRYLLVDEFQDVNAIQYEVLKLLAAPGNHLFVVGDDDQSIYGFRGAKPEIMRTFMQDYPSAHQILLNVNYRSQRLIVDGAGRLIAHNQNRFLKEMRTERPKGDKIRILEFSDEESQGDFTAREIEGAIALGLAPKEIVVLFRIGADADVLAEKFVSRGIPFVLREKVRSIYEHFIAKDLISYLSLARGQGKRRDFLRIVNRPNRYIKRDALGEEEVTYETICRYYKEKPQMISRIRTLEEDMENLRTQTPYAAIQYIRKKIGYETFLEAYAARHGIDLKKFIHVLDEVQERAREFTTTEEYFRHIREYEKNLQENASSAAGEGVVLTTMHGAKGLEYDSVYIMDANEGVIPYKKAVSPEQIEEERRLFYVAVTRARQKLTISFVREKNGKESMPSRFVSELMPSR